VIRLPRLPIAVPPAKHEIVTSYVARLASLHGMPFGELWEQLSVPGNLAPSDGSSSPTGSLK
jgi:hypothetical protein